jgi:hypothetical protein
MLASRRCARICAGCSMRQEAPGLASRDADCRRLHAGVHSGHGFVDHLIRVALERGAADRRLSHSLLNPATTSG